METQNGTHSQLRETLKLIADPSLPSSRRRELEGWLDAHSSVTAQNACMAVQSLDVANDSQLYWYYISCLERHAARLFWTLSSVARMKLMNDVESLLNSCLHISSPLTRKVFSLHTTVLCWGASEQNESAAAALLNLCAPLSDRYQGEQAQDWQMKLERSVVLMDDLQSGLLRPDANSAGVLPAACLTTLRGLFFSELQKRICGLALLAVKGAAAQPRGELQAQHHSQQQQQQTATAARNLELGLDLLGKVLPTVTSAGTLPVTATDLVEVCIPHLSSESDDQAEAALRAVSSICALPMVPSERAVLQKRLLTLLASSQELRDRPLMRARVARAVVELSGMNLLKLDQETCMALYTLLVNVAEEARQRASAQEVLCCLELWMLWLSRYADLSDSHFHPDSAKQDMNWWIEPFRESAGSLVRTLLQCLTRVNETGSAPEMAVKAEVLQLEAYSGAAMEEEISSLCIAETGTAADIEDSPSPAGASDSTTVVQSSEDLCMALSAHSTSVWECVTAALRSRGDLIVSATGAAGERAALDVHVLARLASRCTHELNACDVCVVLRFASTMVDWVTAAMQQLSQNGFGGAQKPVMIAAGAVFKALSALASLWAPEVLHGSAADAPDATAQTFGFLSSLFDLSVSTIHCVLITLPNNGSHSSTTAAGAGGSFATPHPPNEVQLNEAAQYLASCASEALLASSHIAIGNMSLTHDQAASLQRGRAVRALTDVCMHLAATPEQHGSKASQGALGVLPQRVQRDVWVAFADMYATWPSRVRDMSPDQWQAVTTDLRTALAPFLSSWGAVRTHVPTGGAQGANSGTIEWEQTAGVFKRLCTCLSSLLSCVGYLPNPARACVYNAVAPAVEAALDILEVAHCSGAHTMGLEGSRLMVAVVHSVLKEMPVEVVKRMMAVSATAPRGGDALPAQQQVVRLVWRVTDEASNSVASLLPQAMSFLFTTLDSCTLEQLATSAPLAACARQCLCGIMHMLAHRYQAMVAVDAGVKGAVCTAAQRFATFLEAAAAGKVASVHPQDLRELLEEFFDMQRVTGLYKQAEFKQVRMLLEKGLMAMLLNPIADGAKEQLIDVLWGIGSIDWEEFVGTFLVQFCSICSELVQQRTEALIRPFTDQSGSLHDFPHFSSCMDSLLNDLRFFEKLAAAGAPPAKEE